MEQIGYIIFGSLLAIGSTLLSAQLGEWKLKKKLLELLGFEIGVNLILVNNQDSDTSHIFLTDIYKNYSNNLHLLDKELREVIILHYRWITEYEGLKTIYRSGVKVNKNEFERAIADIVDAGNKAIELLTTNKTKAKIMKAIANSDDN